MSDPQPDTGTGDDFDATGERAGHDSAPKIIPPLFRPEDDPSEWAGGAKLTEENKAGWRLLFGGLRINARARTHGWDDPVVEEWLADPYLIDLMGPKPSDELPVARSLRDAALEYVAAGLRVLPLWSILPDGHCGCSKLNNPRPCKPGKHPISGLTPNGCKNATSDVQKVRDWWSNPRHNIGIATGPESGVFVIGPDGFEGIADLAALAAPHGGLPSTRTAESGSGGRHYYFRWPADGGKSFTTAANHRGTKIDFRGEGGYVVAPPSRIPAGVYRWLDTREPAEAPAWLLEWVRGSDVKRTSTASATPAAAPYGTRDRNTIIKRAVAYLDTIPDAIGRTGGKGENNLLNAARALVIGFDLDTGTALGLLLAHYNTRADPPFTVKQVEHKVDEAANKPYSKPRGWLLADTRDRIEEAPPTLPGMPEAQPSEAAGNADTPSGTPDAASPPSGESTGEPTAAEVLVTIGRGWYHLWRDASGLTYATAKPGLTRGDRRTYVLDSTDFMRKLTLGAFFARGKPVSGSAVTDAVRTLDAIASAGPEHRSYRRTAAVGDVTYLHLADTAETVIRIDAEGWRVDPQPPVRFIRTSRMGALPMPQTGGSVEELWSFLNLPDAQARTIFEAYVTWIIRGSGPFPVLICTGPEGSAKTTTLDFLKRLTDPSTTPPEESSCARLPDTVEVLHIRARNSWLQVYTNLSTLSAQMSDEICVMATGGESGGARTHYTMNDLTTFAGRRPFALDGITDFAERADLLSRALLMYHPVIPKDRRKDEVAFRRAFMTAQPRLLGSLLDIVSAGIRGVGAPFGPLPRMADFAQWGAACDAGLGRPPWFREAYTAALDNNRAQAVAACPVANAVVAFMSTRSEWTGTATDLLEQLQQHRPAGQVRGWPKAANTLSGKLNRAALNLRDVYGVIVDTTHTLDPRGKVRGVKLNRQDAGDHHPAGDPMQAGPSAGNDWKTRQAGDAGDAGDDSSSSTAERMGDDFRALRGRKMRLKRNDRRHRRHRRVC